MNRLTVKSLPVLLPLKGAIMKMPKMLKYSENYKIGRTNNYPLSVAVGVAVFLMCMVFIPFLILFALIFLIAGLTGFVKPVINVNKENIVPIVEVNTPFK